MNHICLIGLGLGLRYKWKACGRPTLLDLSMFAIGHMEQTPLSLTWTRSWLDLGWVNKLITPVVTLLSMIVVDSLIEDS